MSTNASPDMLSTPPRSMSTRSGLVVGKKRIMSSPTKSNNNNNNDDDVQTPAKTPKKQPRTPAKTAALTTRDAQAFSQWFRHMIDDDRHNFSLYLAEEVILEWFGRTIRTRKKVSGFLEYDMQCSRHDFTTVVGCAPFVARVERSKRLETDLQEITELATPLDVAETPTAKLKISLNQLSMRGSSLKKRPGLRSSSVSPEKRPKSPEWDPSSIKRNLDGDMTASEKKRAKLSQLESMDVDRSEPDSGRGRSETKRPRSVAFCRKLRFESQLADEGIEEMSHRGDEGKRRYVTTPAKRELGQGDCLPTTSGEAHPRLPFPTPPRRYVECNGFVEFTRSRNKRCADGVTWERKCKLQVCYTEDPVNVGEYVIWTIVYSDDIKCRRNLLAAFEEVAKVEETKRKLF